MIRAEYPNAEATIDAMLAVCEMLADAWCLRGLHDRESYLQAASVTLRKYGVESCDDLVTKALLAGFRAWCQARWGPP